MNSGLSIVPVKNICCVNEDYLSIFQVLNESLKICDVQGQRKVVLLQFDIEQVCGKKINRAYLRLVNDKGHNKNATAIISAGRVLNRWAVGDSGIGILKGNTLDKVSSSSTVFRVPEWQPTWLIDVTDIVLGLIDDDEKNNGIYLKGGIVDEPLNLKCNTGYLGLDPMLLIIHSQQESDELCDEQKIKSALEALHKIYLNRDMSWSGSFVRNAQANADQLGWGLEFRSALETYFDCCISEEGSFKNISEAYFYASSCGQALIHLYQQTKKEKYIKALKLMRDGLHALPRSQEGIIMADDRVEIELVFCVCPFLTFYNDAFNDKKSCDLAIKQCILIYDIMSEGQEDGIPLQNIKKPNSKGWSRGMGWVVAGMGKLISSPGIRSHCLYPELLARFVSLSEILAFYQTSSGMWRSIIQDLTKPEEVTGSALIALGFEYGYQQKVLDLSYEQRVDKTMEGILRYTKTGIDMGNCFPMNFFEQYEVTDFSGNSDQGFGAWMELFTLYGGRAKCLV